MNINIYYQTSDLALATVISLYYPIDSIDRQNPQKIQFNFIRNQELDQLIENYWHGELKINPQVYFNQLKTLKSRIHGG